MRHRVAIFVLDDNDNVLLFHRRKPGEEYYAVPGGGNYQYFYVSKTWSGTPALGGEELERESPTNVYDLVWMPIEELNEIDLRGKQKEMLLNYLNR